MNRRGFVLLTVLWAVVLLTAVAATIARSARLGTALSRNRISFTRAEWARDACLNILLARVADGEPLVGTETVDLGQGSHCRLVVELPESRLNINFSTQQQLVALIGDTALVSALLDWRDEDTLQRRGGAERQWYKAHRRRPPRDGPLADPRELSLVRGFEAGVLDAFESDITTRGSGLVDLNAASAEVLATLPGIGGEAVAILEAHRASGHPVEGLEALGALLSPTGRARLFDAYQDLLRLTVFRPTIVLAHMTGWVDAARVRAKGTATLVPMDKRLAVVRMELQ